MTAEQLEIPASVERIGKNFLIWIYGFLECGGLTPLWIDLDPHMFWMAGSRGNDRD